MIAFANMDGGGLHLGAENAETITVFIRTAPMLYGSLQFGECGCPGGPGAESGVPQWISDTYHSAFCRRRPRNQERNQQIHLPVSSSGKDSIAMEVFVGIIQTTNLPQAL